MPTVIRTLRAALALLLMCSLVAPAARASGDDSARNDVKKFYAKLEKVLNSDAFQTNPSLALPFFDTDTIILYDAMLPEKITGKAFAKHWIDVSLAAPTKVSYIDMDIQAHDDLAFVSYIQHFVGHQKNGPPFDMRTPTTDCLVKSHGKWKIVHQHAAQQLDDDTLAALMNKSTAAPSPGP